MNRMLSIEHDSQTNDFSRLFASNHTFADEVRQSPVAPSCFPRSSPNCLDEDAFDVSLRGTPSDVWNLFQN